MAVRPHITASGCTPLHFSQWLYALTFQPVSLRFHIPAIGCTPLNYSQGIYGVNLLLAAGLPYESRGEREIPLLAHTIRESILGFKGNDLDLPNWFMKMHD